MKRILHISPCFNYNCGRSSLVYLYLTYFKNKTEYEIHFITNGGDSLERLKINNINYTLLNFSQGIKNLFYREKFFKELKSYILKNNIQLIHTHHRFPEYISVKAAKQLDISTVTSAHSFVKGYKNISFGSDKIISVSNSLSSYLQKQFNINKERIITLYSPAAVPSSLNPQDSAGLKEELGLNSGNNVILFMGRINYEKGYDVLLKSFETVRNKYKEAVLVFCGNVEDKNFRKISKKFHNSLLVIHPRENLELLYDLSEIVVLPSRTDSFPLVMIEAGAYRKPFIGGNTGGIAEFIEQGKNGLLVEPGNPEDLAEKIMFLLNDKESARALGQNLYNKVREKCDYKNYFIQVEKIYDSLLN